MSEQPEADRLAGLPAGVSPFRTPAKDDQFQVHQDLDLRRAIELLVQRVQGVRAVFLFGSRRFRTGSARSDVDLIICGDQLPAASAVASIARDLDTYLDVFIAREGVAQSAINESVIAAQNRHDLLEMLDARPLWRSEEGWVGEGLEAVRILAGFTPAYTIAAPAGPEPIVAKVDILLVSALQVEYHAAVATFDRLIESLPPDLASFSLGEIDDGAGAPRRVAACVADRAGTVPAALATFRGIELFRPQLVALVGITAGIEGRVALGDIVVPDTVVEYEATKVEPNGEDFHGRAHPIAPAAIAAVKGWQRLDQWLADLSARRPDGPPFEVSTDSMASGNKVIASAERASLIAASSRKLVAIEMEALGMVEACLRARPAVSPFVVKSVSDLANERKRDDWHPFGSWSAATFVSTLIRERVI